MMRVLITAAHPDDIELGMGGTVKELTKNGIFVLCYHATNGTYTDIYENVIRQYDEIVETTSKSLGGLGVPPENVLFNPKINATDLKVNKESISAVQKLILDHHITDLYTHMKIDTYHQDHMATHLISMAATRRYINNIYCFESISNYAEGLMLPNTYIDITNSIEDKCNALRFHTTEYDKFGKEQWIESVKSLANYRGLQVRVKYAEAFTIMKQIRGFSTRE